MESADFPETLVISIENAASGLRRQVRYRYYDDGGRSCF
jgi:hypothetical protein